MKKSRLFELEVDSLTLDVKNPRITTHLEQWSTDEDDQESLETIAAETLEHEPHHARLREQIEAEEQIIVPILVNHTNNLYIVFDGNNRTHIVKTLYKEARQANDEERMQQWSKVPCRVYENLSSNEMDQIRTQVHMGGVKGWGPYNEAADLKRQIIEHEMNPESHRNIRDIAIDAKEAVSEVRKIVKAYDHMNEDYLTYLKKTDPDISAIEKSFQRKFSYFKEFLDMSINREVKTICKNKYPERDHIELFCEWVADGRIGKGEHVRHLDKIFSNSKARREFFRPDPIVDRISASESALGYINLPDLSKADVKVLAKAISQRLTSLDLDEIEEFNAFSECLEMVETVNTKLDTFARVQGNL